MATTVLNPRNPRRSGANSIELDITLQINNELIETQTNAVDGDVGTQELYDRALAGEFGEIDQQAQAVVNNG